MVANTWIAAGAGNWSDDENWSLGHSPIAGEDPTFDGTSTNNCAANDDTPTGVLTIAAGYSGTITQSSDMYISGYSQAGGTFTGINTKWVHCSGDFVRTGGTFTSYVTKINFTDNDLTYTRGSAFYFYELQNNVKLTLNTNINTVRFVNNDEIVIGTNLFAYIASNVYSSTFVNNGMITSTTGYILFQVEKSYTFDIVVQCKVLLQGNTVASNKILSLSADSSILNIEISDVVGNPYTITLDLNGHSLTASSITVGTRGILQCGEGTITTRSLDSSAGAITEETAKWIFNGTGNLKMAAGQKLYDAAIGSETAIISDITVSNEITLAGNQANGVYAITHEGGGSKWYDRRRVHLQKDIINMPLRVRPGDIALSHLSREALAC